MAPNGDDLSIRDFAPGSDTFLAEVIRGLRKDQKTVPCKYLYDERGSDLFEEITELEEYYPTRTELGIMNRYAEEMAAAAGPDCLLIEYGSGSGRKTRLLLDEMVNPAAYVPIEISMEALTASAQALDAEYPDLEILPVCADYTGDFVIPEPKRKAHHRLVYFPGSTIGNFAPEEATSFLSHVRDVVGIGGGLLIGVDLKKDPEILEAAYDDRKGVTAAFNLNLLTRMNRELGADFPVGRFSHRAVYNEDRGRVEMHLVSEEDLTVRVGGEEFRFEEGETIHTENSYKFTVDSFAALAATVGFDARRVWTDRTPLFSIQHLVAV